MSDRTADPLHRSDTEPAETVFVLDDERALLGGMQALLARAGYAVRTFTVPDEALAELGPDTPKVLVTDYSMPGLNGLEVTEQALAENPWLKVVLVTGAGDEKVAQAALRTGVFDYITKPFDGEQFVQTVFRAFMAHARDSSAHASEGWLRSEVERQTTLIRSMTVGTLKALMNAQEARIRHFKGHSEAVARSAAGVAQALELSRDEIASIKTAGLLHDIGMIAVSDAIVNKPGALTPEEVRAVQAHPQRGAEIVAPMEHLAEIRRYILEHHERLDGSGYPDGKRGDEISLGGQIVGLAEAWTALTEDRSFRSGKSAIEAIETLSGTEGAWFSRDLLTALRRAQISRK